LGHGSASPQFSVMQGSGSRPEGPAGGPATPSAAGPWLWRYFLQWLARIRGHFVAGLWVRRVAVTEVLTAGRQMRRVSVFSGTASEKRSEGEGPAVERLFSLGVTTGDRARGAAATLCGWMPTRKAFWPGGASLLGVGGAEGGRSQARQ
jgi:hypothetical protein